MRFLQTFTVTACVFLQATNLRTCAFSWVYQFDGESNREPNVCHMDDVEHIYLYDDCYNRRVAQMAHDSEADSAWVEQVLNGSDWDFDSEDDQ